MGGGEALGVAAFFIMGAGLVVGASVLLAAFLVVLAVAAIVVGVLLIAGAYGYGPWAWHDPSANSRSFNGPGGSASSGGLGGSLYGGQTC